MKKQTLYIIFGVVVFTLACSLGTPIAPTQPQRNQVETVVAGTMQALTQNAPQGTRVSFEDVSLLIPTALGTGANTKKTDDIEYPPCANPSCVYPAEVMPQHIVFTINGYPLAREAWVAVFNAAEYAGIDEHFSATISDLRSLKGGLGTIPDSLTSRFAAGVHAMNFQDGYGFRYLTQMNDAPMPINNERLFYYFKGLTDDGTYFVMAILPITAPMLAEDGKPEAPIPAGGVPFPAGGMGDEAYYTSVTEKLNALPPDSYTPSLNALDLLIESLLVTNP
ncbi:MAG TPA: hypothetical protein VHP14_10805 [Anaerolineales bacterium]|nr:hypothetical protein [Anaerolineales bacterium]